MVFPVGLEPTRIKQQILSLPCIPIPPREQKRLEALQRTKALFGYAGIPWIEEAPPAPD